MNVGYLFIVCVKAANICKIRDHNVLYVTWVIFYLFFFLDDVDICLIGWNTDNKM